MSAVRFCVAKIIIAVDHLNVAEIGLLNAWRCWSLQVGRYGGLIVKHGSAGNSRMKLTTYDIDGRESQYSEEQVSLP